MENQKEILIDRFLQKKLSLITQEIALKGFSIISEDSATISIKESKKRILEYNVFSYCPKEMISFLEKNGLAMNKSKTRPFKYTFTKRINSSLA